MSLTVSVGFDVSDVMRDLVSDVSVGCAGVVSLKFGCISLRGSDDSDVTRDLENVFVGGVAGGVSCSVSSLMGLDVCNVKRDVGSDVFVGGVSLTCL